MEATCSRVKTTKQLIKGEWVDHQRIEERLDGSFIPSPKKLCGHNWKNHPDQKGNNQYCTICGDTRLVQSVK